MTFKGFHKSGTRRGVTLVELAIAMLILAVVCIAWMHIIGMRSARKEARRREAVERLAGMMDAFLYEMKNSAKAGCWRVDIDENLKMVKVRQGDTDAVYPVFGEDVSPVGYRLEVVKTVELDDAEKFDGWGDGKLWLVGRLYQNSGSLADCGYPFFSMPVCTGL